MDKPDRLDDPAFVKRLLTGFYVVCGMLFALDFILTRKVEHPWEIAPAFYAIYGFVGCVILVVIAKWMRRFLMRDEDYYDGPDSNEPAEQRGAHVDD